MRGYKLTKTKTIASDKSCIILIWATTFTFLKPRHHWLPGHKLVKSGNNTNYGRVINFTAPSLEKYKELNANYCSFYNCGTGKKIELSRS